MTTSISDAALRRLSSSPQALSQPLSALQETLAALTSLKGGSPLSVTLGRALLQVERELNELSGHLKTGHELPLSLAIMGGTNTGKSTTLNLIAGEEVSREKVTANATKRPLIYAHESWRAQLMSPSRPWPRPELSEDSDAPVQTEATVTPLLRLHQDEALRELILIDCPDLDSTETANVHSAADITRWADRALFLVTPQKYKDGLLVTALQGLLRRGQRVHVLFNMVTEGHRVTEMVEDLKRCVGLSGAEAQLLSVEAPVARQAREARPQLGDQLHEQLLRPMLKHDHQAERRDLLRDRLGRALSSLRALEELLELLEATQGELSADLERLGRRAARGLAEVHHRLGAQGTRARLTLSSLTLSELLSSAQRSAVASAAPAERLSHSGEGARALRLSLTLLSELSRKALKWLSELIIEDALRRSGVARALPGESRAQLISPVLKSAQQLIERLERPEGSVSQRPEGSSERIFQLKRAEESALYEGLGREVAEALSSRELSWDEGALRRALSAQVSDALSALLSEHEGLTAQLHAQLYTGEGAERLSSHERTLMIALKGVSGLSLAYLSFGFGLWDLLWAPLGYELGTYLVTWRISPQLKTTTETLDPQSLQRWERLTRELVVSPIAEDVALSDWMTAEQRRHKEQLTRQRLTLEEELR